ncbi:MAG: large-conductance mechanosensitive channel protein MscL [Bacteroidales bacterium]|jgi:large conductance mechanosensitive channel
MGKFAKDFKEFALKGNVVDMAVGVIIGAAFGKIVTSLVDDILMPLVGYWIGGVNFNELKFVLKQATETTEAVTVNYGAFIQTLIDFLLIALTLYFIIKVFMDMAKNRKEEEKNLKVRINKYYSNI